MVAECISAVNSRNTLSSSISVTAGDTFRTIDGMDSGTLESIATRKETDRESYMTTFTSLSSGGAQMLHQQAVRDVSMMTPSTVGTRSKEARARLSKRFAEAKKQITSEISNLKLDRKKPWVDAKGRIVWSSQRIFVAKIMLNTWTDLLLSLIIIFNLGLIIFETDQEAKCFPEFKGDLDHCPTEAGKYYWLTWANHILLCIYSVEAALNIYVLRMQYFRHGMKWFDFAICVGGWLSVVFGNLLKISWFRILRCGRIFKAIRFLDSIPELWMLFAGFIGSMKAMFFGSLILLGLLGFFSIIIVQFVHPINASLSYSTCESCSEGFSDISTSMLTLFQQIVAGDSWGEISVPVIKDDSVGLLLIFTQIVISIGAMNLILGVIVDRAVDAREKGKVHRMKEIANEQKKRKLHLLSLMREMDINGDGTVDRKEVLHAAESSVEFASRLNMVGVSAAELEEMCDYLQDEVTGDITYVALCNALHDVEAADVRKIVVLARMNLLSMNQILLERLDSQDAVLNEIGKQIAHFSGDPGLRDEHVLKRSRAPPCLTPGKRKAREKSKMGEKEKVSIIDRVSLASAESMPEKEATFDIDIEEPKVFQVSPYRFSGLITDFHPNGRMGQDSTPPYLDAVRSCEDQLVAGTNRLRQTLADLDTSWNRALQIARGTSSATIDIDADFQNIVDGGNRLRDKVVNHNHLKRDSQRHRSRLFQCLADLLEDEVASMLRDCKAFTPTVVNVPVLRERNDSNSHVAFEPGTPKVGES